ncbi:MAG: glycogen/starch synthase [Bacteroidota bacterium]
MDKKRVLIITQEMQPYTVLSEISEIARKLPQYVQENGMEIRVLMPRFGTINERRHRLHEVVRLSGMNIIVAEDDYPLIIKVASLPGARMQVYFLDNEDFFKRKQVFTNESGQPFEDNEDRMVFFCKGAVETVKKFGWAPDIVHCHGWMTSLVPLYLKTAYKDEPIFKGAKVIYSLYPDTFEESFTSAFADKASINDLNADDLSEYLKNGGVTLHEGATKLSDAVVLGSENLNGLGEKLKDLDKPLLEFPGKEEYLSAYLDFYQTLLAE